VAGFVNILVRVAVAPALIALANSPGRGPNPNL